jgi:hypothetical protein
MKAERAGLRMSYIPRAKGATSGSPGTKEERGGKGIS